MKIFDDFLRVNTNIAFHDSSRFTFLNESAWPSTNYIREQIELWAKSFPINPDFISRFRSIDDQQHKSAFFELIIFQLFKVQNFNIEVHKRSDLKSTRLPDFKITKGTTCFYVECTLGSNPLVDPEAKRIKAQICDVVEKIPCYDYFINIDFLKVSTKQPSLKSFEGYIYQILKEAKELTDFNINSIPNWIFNNNEWQIQISLIKKTKPAERSLGGVSNGHAKVINSQRPVRTSLNNKRGSNYGKFSDPYIIALNSEDFTLEKSEIITTLYGSYSDDYFIKNKINENAYFLIRGIPQNTRVSGVLIAHGLNPWNLHIASLELWHNPWCEFPFNTQIIEFDQYYFNSLDNNKFSLNFIPGRSVKDLLQIDSDQITVKNGL